MPRIELTATLPTDVDVIVVGATAGTDAAELAAGHGLSDAAAAYVVEALATLDAKGDAESTVTVLGVPEITVPVVVVGLGKEELTLEGLRRAAGTAVRALAGKTSVAVALPATSADELGAIAEGIHFGSYTFTHHLSETKREKAKKAPESVKLVSTVDGAAAVLTHAEIVGKGMTYARDLVNLAPNELYPETFAQSVKDKLGGKLSVTIHDEKKLEELGAGLILGVGLGSTKAPRIAVIEHSPEGAKQHIALVGKGVTFDSGGLCIKPGTGMVTMKCDMGGAAAVAGAMLAIAELEVPVKVTAYLALVENMTGPDAQRPGDVRTAVDGTTVEIINTDAEGRLAMADAICLAAQTDAELIVDIATLTGAAVVALGERTAAVLGNSDEIRTEIHELGKKVGENFWPIPIAEEIRPAMKSMVADLKHTGPRVGGMMTAGRFLQEFVGKNAEGEETSWAHLDIAGPAFIEGETYGYFGKGGTGYGVRTLIALLEQRAGK